jgi:hypothetical protein
MKKIILLALMLTAIASASAYYVGEEISGTKKYCTYSDGTVITVNSYDMCPMNL